MLRSELCFAYGSNMEPSQMRERCPESSLSWFIAEARGWRLCFPRRSPKRRGACGGLRRDKRGIVWGVVFSVSPQDLERLDQFEGVAQGAYQRERLEVLDQNGQSHSAWAYFAVPENPPEEYKPAKDYLGLFIQGAEHFGLPGYYVQELQMIESTD